MAGSTAQRFYPKATRTASFPAGVYDIDATAPAAQNLTSTVTFTTTAQTQFLVKPLTAGTAQNAPASGGAATGFGWRFTSTIMDTTGEQRVLLAGTTTIVGEIHTGTYALLAANPNYTLTAILYKIDTGGTSTEIARASSAATAVAASTAAALTCSLTVPKTLFSVGETMQIEFYLTGQATANALNQVTNNACSFGIETATFADLTSPGLRTQYSRTASVATTLSTTVTRVASHPRTASITTALSTAVSRAATYARSIPVATSLSTLVTRTAAYPRTVSVTTTLSTLAKRVVAFQRTASVVTTLSTTVTRRFTGSRLASVATSLSTSIARAITYGRTINIYPTGVTPDFVVNFPLKKLSDYVIDHETGLPLTSTVATVEIFRDTDNQLVQTTTSNPADGSFTVLRDLYDPYTYWYKARYNKADGTQVHGVSDRGQTPVPV